jgi:hypothetical protein
MAEKKVDVYYQAPGETEWQYVVSEAKESPATPRLRARALLAAADVAAARATSSAGLGPEEVFELDMAKAIGAWGRVVEIERKRFERGVGNVIDRLFKKR